MELKQFITTTLNDIIDGIADSQVHAKEKNAIVNAPTSTIDSNGFDTEGINSWYKIQKIEFDVAVTVTEEDKLKAGIGVLSAVLNVGVQGEDNLTNSSVTRVKFSVPVLFPTENEG